MENLKIFIALNVFLLLFNVKSFGWNSPNLSSPVTGTNVWTGIVLDWNSVLNSQFYQVQADTTNTFNSAALVSASKLYINSNNSNTDTEHSFGNLLFFGTTYYWRVRAYITGDTSAWSTVWTFNTRDYVSLNSPVTGSNQWTGLTLDWLAHPGIDFYDVEADTTATFNSAALISASKQYINSNNSNTDTEHSFGNLLYFGTTYYWRVRARNNVDTSSWSTVWNFNTRDYVSLNSPVTGSNQWTGLTLDWLAHPGVDFYDVEADTTATFNSAALISASKQYINSNNSNTDTEHSFGNLIYFGATYYWRVRARNNVDTSSWSTVWTFDTRDYVSLISPNNGQLNVNIAGITLDWNAHAGIDIYQLEIDTVILFNSTFLITINKNYINSSNGNNDTEYGTGPLLTNKAYFWRVRALNAIDTSAWSARSFSTGVCIPPSPTISANGPTTFCQGNTVLLTATTSSTYLWSNNATTQSITVSSAGSYTVTVSDGNGCSGSSGEIIVTVNPLPTAAVTPNGPTTFCTGGNVTLTASSASNYSWSGGQTTQAITVSASGNYSVTVTNANGCSATSAPETVIVTSIPPTPAILQNADTLTSSSITNNQWYLNGTIISGATSQNYVPTVSGDYTVMVTNNCGTATSNPFTINIVGIQSHSEVFSLESFPNPFYESVSINYALNSASAVTLEIYNVQGEKVTTLVYNENQNSGKHSYLFERKNAGGLYFIKLFAEDRLLIKKIIGL